MTTDRINVVRLPWSPAADARSGTAEALRLRLRTLAEAEAGDPDARTIAAWVRGYLMRPHEDLGRTGHVCPFTAQAARLDLLRIGISPLDGNTPDDIRATMRQALRDFDAMPCTRGQRIFRTIVVGFPNCAGADGISALHGVQNALRHHSIVLGKMVGLFEPNSAAEGLINRDFRPLRAPLPILAIRTLVEQDAPFVLRNPLLAPIYVVKFPLAGTRRLLGCAFSQR